MTDDGLVERPPAGLQPAIIGTAIKFRRIVVALSLLLLVYGALSVTQAKYDVFPEFAPPQVGIQTEAPGLAAEEIEVLVTQPLENAISGVSGIRSLRSTSTQGLSVLTVIFDAGSDIYLDRQVVAERLANAAQQLPAGVKPPVLTPLTSSSSTVLVAGLTSETKSLMDIRTSADWTVRLRLLAVPGVSKVAVFGGDVRSIQIQVHPEALIRYGIGLEDVVAASRKATAVRGAGFLDTPNQRIVFRSEGQAINPVEVGRTVVTTSGASSVTLADLATIADAPEPAIGGATIMGRPGVIFVISAQFGTNTVEVTRRVEEALAALRPALESQGMELDTTLFRPATFIDVATKSVRDALLLGGVFVIVVLFLFLFDIRTAAISCIAIPLSLLAAVIVLNSFGVTLNTMTLGGLAIAIGEVVDDAVIDVENIVRRLRENRHKAQPRPAARVVLDASLEVRSAVVYATFIVMLVFIPVLTLPGIAGRFFAPLALAYILALVASLIIALTVTPALCMMLLTGKTGSQQDVERPPPLVRWIRGPYESLLAKIAKHPTAVISAATAFTICGSGLLPFFGSAFLPEFKEGHYTLHMTAIPGTSIAESERLGLLVTKALVEVPSIRSISQRVGRAESADDTWGTNYSEIEVDLQPGLSGAELSAADADIRKALLGFPGLNFSLKPFLTERVEETLSGNTAAVAANIYGNDLNELDEVAAKVSTAMASVHGARDVRLRTPAATPQLTIRLREDDLVRWGLTAVDVLDIVRTAYQGDVVGQAYDGHRAFNIITLLDTDSRNSVAKIADLPIRTRSGTYVLLRQVADVNQTTGRYQVDHFSAHRLQTVTADVSGGDVVSYVANAQKAVAKVKLPAGVYVEFAGSAQAQAQARRDLIVHSLMAFAGVLLLLSIITKNWRNLVLILVNIPFALVGGVIAIYFTGATLTIGSMVGFVALFGISLRNSIMMISHYEQLVVAEDMPWDLKTAIKGAGDRLTPIVMTSLVTALGLLPLAAGMSEPGREIQGPMAMVILGGLFSSSILNLLILPTLTLRFGRFAHQDNVLLHRAPTPASSD
ncbi:efflux RND transporter permease subunit [Methyloferula stellata]|uniref:efflux RND transporter permease subunit n=1 Tax=Methyloferula stellata TaxID=876270 RepID=UPI00036C79A1|nr:efflux RND transporter permease subunit [Methyloferula stellata]